MKLDGGFKSYICYVAIKAHFKSKSYDINKGFPKKSLLLSKWNNIHFNTDGKLYYAIEEHYPNLKELVYLYSIYHWYNDKFFVTDIIDDRFQLWEKHKKELINIKETLELDLITLMDYCVKNKIKLKDLIISKNILNQDISLFTLIIFNMIFNLTEKIDCDNIISLERKKIEDSIFKLDKITKIYYDRFKDTNWKLIIKEKLR